MFELLQTIALLCSSGKVTEESVAKCQAWYIQCVENTQNTKWMEYKLKDCVLKKAATSSL